MDSSLLEKFRRQLAAWIEQRLENHPLPFQKLEVSPRILTTMGRLSPDLVLWINRDSQLAGSMILLPVTVDEKTMAEGRVLAEALGLKHFTTWAAREVCIWSLSGKDTETIHSFKLPEAKHILPQDFQDTLDELLEKLKIVTVTHSLSREELSVYYFANLCLHNLHELAPGLTMSARLKAGQTEADEWVEKAPREKAWLSLWRILFLLWQGKLPPGLRPDRLEDAIRYALSDTSKEALPFTYTDDEPSLPEGDAVRLYHLAGRLRQLGWPQDSTEAEQLVWLLLDEAAHRFHAATPPFPWGSNEAQLRVSCHPDNSTDVKAMIAPRAYLAGWALMSALNDQAGKVISAESLSQLNTGERWDNAVASFDESHRLDRKEYEEYLILLRKAWPNRRFDLPRSTPFWVWEIIFLIGLTSSEFTLTLPQDWQDAAGLEELWKLLEERCQLTELAIDSNHRPSLRFQHNGTEALPCRMHREGNTLELPEKFSSGQRPGTIQFWLTADLAVINKVIETMSCRFGEHWPEELEQLEREVSYYLETTLGRYIWDICSHSAPQPDVTETLSSVMAYGVPLPDTGVLTELALTHALTGQETPQQEQLDHEFELIFGDIPPIDRTGTSPQQENQKAQRQPRISSEDISRKVFSDGLPRFPEHYLMGAYKAELTQYEIKGPLKITADFFDRFSLQTEDGHFSIDVNGRELAEALVLASHGGGKNVELPEDEEFLGQIISSYRADLQKLWDMLVRECRRVAPVKKTAARLAKRIWNTQKLPPVSP